MSVFSERLTEMRKQRGYTQKHLAELLGISPTRLNYWEKGKREPDVVNILEIAKTLDVSIDYLIGNSDNPQRRIIDVLLQIEDRIKKQLLADFDRLTYEGQHKVREYIADLLTNPKYALSEEDEPPKLEFLYEPINSEAD